MAEIKGSDSDAVQVEAHSLLETSTPIADTETQDRSQDGQLSCKEEVKGKIVNLRNLFLRHKIY